MDGDGTFSAKRYTSTINSRARFDFSIAYSQLVFVERFTGAGTDEPDHILVLIREVLDALRCVGTGNVEHEQLLVEHAGKVFHRRQPPRTRASGRDHHVRNRHESFQRRADNGPVISACVGPEAGVFRLLQKHAHISRGCKHGTDELHEA